jgi:cytoskeletal protein CcmA (bactofilin family)
MSDQPRRRLADRSAATPTLVGHGSTMNGTLNCAGDLVISGEFIGDAKVGGSLTLAAEGRWEGDLETANAVICGEFIGDVQVTEKLEIRKSARIRGGIRAKSIAIETGAVVDGEMAVTSGKPVVRFEEKRHK